MILTLILVMVLLDISQIYILLLNQHRRVCHDTLAASDKTHFFGSRRLDRNGIGVDLTGGAGGEFRRKLRR